MVFLLLTPIYNAIKNINEYREYMQDYSYASDL